jgi:mRNA interferase MazF
MVAPVTSTIRGAPSEVVVGVKEGLKHESAVNLDHVQTVERARLTGYVGQLGPDRMREVCRALSIAVGCDG